MRMLLTGAFMARRSANALVTVKKLWRLVRWDSTGMT